MEAFSAISQMKLTVFVVAAVLLCSQLLVFSNASAIAVVIDHNATERKPYIVYMGDAVSTIGLADVDHHHSLLTDAIGDEDVARESKIHSYGRSFNGFAANLLPHEALSISKSSSVVSVFVSQIRQVQTTRSWDYIGMTKKRTKRHLAFESNTIIGLLDTGIYMDAPSFSDKGIGPPPSKWKGKCTKGQNFTTGCNNKVIGAKYYDLIQKSRTQPPSPADFEGHGTHTSSTAAGNWVKHASLLGIAKGHARGAVPYARIAMYKVCWDFGCSDQDILAAYDDAIADGVDVLSLSLGAMFAQNFFEDSVAIGAYHAMKKGIPTICAGGNTGPAKETVSNIAPWIFTVAASSIDRRFRTDAVLGNGVKVKGVSINTFSRTKQYPLILGSNAAANDSLFNGTTCMGQLDKEKVRGKIVLCYDFEGAFEIVSAADGAGSLISVNEIQDMASIFTIPALTTTYENGAVIAHYVNSTKNPTAEIRKTTTYTSEGTKVASFSSRGPQYIARNILKPDISAPGLDILAGYTTLTSLTGYPDDTRHTPFNIMSGTSMATPHASGVVAYIKSFHPDWSPAAIKSAIMTTATPIIENGNEIPFNTGAGQINPLAATHPGLIYDMGEIDYLRYLCREGYNSTTLSLLAQSGKHFNCSDLPKAVGFDGINYPTMHLQLLIDETKFDGVFYRTVTNVGYGAVTYKATISGVTANVDFKVVPDTLQFKRTHQKKSFKVMVKGEMKRHMPTTVNAVLDWSDGKHHVRSHIVIFKPTL